MIKTTTSSKKGSLILLTISVFLISINLRALFTSLSTILSEVIQAVNLSATQASILTTLPILCLGVFAIPAPALARRFGTERTIFIALTFITLGTALRANNIHIVLFSSTLMAGAGIAICNVLLPGLIKRDFGDWAGTMTGVFTMGLCTGAAAAASYTQPILYAFNNSWMIALAIWSIPALIASIVWLPYAIKGKPSNNLHGTKKYSLWHDSLAWQVTLFMGLQSASAYIVIGWLSQMLREKGMDATDAGYTLGISIIGQMIATLILPSIAKLKSNQSLLAVSISALSVSSFIACLYLPIQFIWLYSFLLGISQGASISLAILLIVLRSGEPNITAQLSGMAQGVGYIIAAIGTLIVGIIRDISGDFNSSILIVVAMGIVQALNGYGAGRNLLVKIK